ncbi:MAG TPA: lysylphosphatidylglycerol synthase transmembrane domain-containing protein [Aggregatilineales bacterium]|nr:lysylphosphatidylglycerol synthase transmembrane domain-containing protein [Aggregatilineales bacterium]
MRRLAFLLIGIVVSAVCLYIGFSGLDLSHVWDGIIHANYLWLIPGVAVYFLAVWGRTWRWHYLLRPLKQISLSKLFPIVVIGYMGNNVYPFRAGEVIRAYVLKRNEDVKITASLATIIVERIFDGLVMLIFVFVALPFANIAQDWLRNMVIAGTIAFFGALAVFLFMAARPVLARRVYSAIIQRFLPHRFQEPILTMADHFMSGLESLHRPRDLAMTLVSSCFIWLTETTKYWFVMHAFNFHVSFFVLMLMTAVVNLATTLPGAPGYVGTFDGPGIAVLKGFGVDGAIAASYTLVLHAALWLPITLLGFYYLAREGLGWRSFSEASRVVESERQQEDERLVPAESEAAAG